MIVLKFGGSSVGSAANIRLVKDILAAKKGNKPLFVVVSAMGGITNKLERAATLASRGEESYEAIVQEIERIHLTEAKELLPVKAQGGVLSRIKMLVNELEDILKGVFLLQELTAKSKDYVLGFGERLSSLMIANYFEGELGQTALIDPTKYIVCEPRFGNGNVLLEKSQKRVQVLKKDLAPINICPGFIASTEKGELITLGRGGSDYSAALFANFLAAESLEIWTDVDGLMTADPRWVKSAHLIEHLAYEEALELSHFGAKVIYPPTIQPALMKNIPIAIKNTFNPSSPGTTITRSWEDTETIRGISSIHDISLLNLSGSGMVGIPNFSYRLFRALSDEQVNVVMITQASSEHTICVAVETSFKDTAVVAINRAFENEIKLHKVNPVEVEDQMAIVALVGSNMRHQVGVAGQMFNTLGNNGISIKAIAQGSSERNITVVIDQNDLRKAINSLHESFFSNEIKSVNLFVVGTGNVGMALLDQLRQQHRFLHDNYHLDLRVIGMANSRKMHFDEEGIPLDQWTSLLYQGEEYTIDSFLGRMAGLNLRNSLFVDVTASADIAEVYAEVLKRSISVVTPNKLAATSPYQHYHTLKHLARKYKSHFLFETNVCAGLPVISTLSDLVKSGDRIRKIEGVFSGTLNFIFNHYAGTTTFSDIVRTAKNEGYTEPDPRLDLSGEDVMRKILILTRESGFQMDFEDVEGVKFVPDRCMEARDIESFFGLLLEEEAHFQALYRQAEEKGKKLRFVAKYENGKATAGLEHVGDDHPFYHLAGKDNIVLFYTDRYREQPLVVKGAGAGAEVTASGIFADIMKVANAKG